MKPSAQLLVIVKLCCPLAVASEVSATAFSAPFWTDETPTQVRSITLTLCFKIALRNCPGLFNKWKIAYFNSLFALCLQV